MLGRRSVALLYVLVTPHWVNVARVTVDALNRRRHIAQRQNNAAMRGAPTRPKREEFVVLHMLARRGIYTVEPQGVHQTCPEGRTMHCAWRKCETRCNTEGCTKHAQEGRVCYCEHSAKLERCRCSHEGQGVYQASPKKRSLLQTWCFFSRHHSEG
jgi:hypothetical protein